MTQIAKAGFFYFLMVFAVGFLLGTIRVIYLIPRFGPVPAVLIELPILLAISWSACGIVLRHIEVPPQFGERLAMGTVAFVILMLAEVIFATLEFGQAIPDYLAQYSTAHGALGLAGQVVFAFFPVLRLAMPTGDRL